MDRVADAASGSDDFDLHAERHRLKQLRDDGDTSLFENRDGVRCPVCGSSFDRVFSTTARGTSFHETDDSRFCLLRGTRELYVFGH